MGCVLSVLRFPLRKHLCGTIKDKEPVLLRAHVFVIALPCNAGVFALPPLGVVLLPQQLSTTREKNDAEGALKFSHA